MALKLIANYSKRLGLPGYSSHQFAVTVETEISNISEVATESSRLYQLLQQNMDEEIQHTGFVPDESYGISEQGSRNGHRTNGTNGHTNGNGNGHATNGNGVAWQCSDKQRDLILKVIGENNLDKAEIEFLAQTRFDGKGVKQLNKLEASGLIDEMLERVGQKPNRGGKRRTCPPAYQNGGGR